MLDSTDGPVLSERGGRSWQVKRLEVKNFRNFETLSLDLSWPLTVLAGLNGSGKTAILDSLAVMLSPIVSEFGGKGPGFQKRDARLEARDLPSSRSVARLEPIYPVEAYVSAILNGEKAEWQRKLAKRGGRTSQARIRVEGTGEPFSKPPEEGQPWPVFAYYGVERLVGVRRGQGVIALTRSGAYEAALDPQSDLTRLFAFFRGLDEQLTTATTYGDPEPRAARAQFDAIAAACNEVLAEVGWSRPRYNPSAKEMTLLNDAGQEVPFSWLASGPKTMAGLVIDLASRMARANPGLGETLLSETPGVVMIDEVDLHLHPGWQQKIMPTLLKAFPQVQFIVTTHSPQVLSTVEASCIRVLEGSSVVVPEHAEGLRSDIILREIQHVDAVPRHSRKRVKLDEYLDLVFSGEGESDRAKSLRFEIERALGSSSNVPELLEADAHIAVSKLDW